MLTSLPNPGSVLKSLEKEPVQLKIYDVAGAGACQHSDSTPGLPTYTRSGVDRGPLSPPGASDAKRDRSACHPCPQPWSSGLARAGPKRINTVSRTLPCIGAAVFSSSGAALPRVPNKHTWRVECSKTLPR